MVEVNKNPIKFKGETMVEVRTVKNKITLPILLTENKNTQPLLGLDWLDKLEIGLQGNTNTNIIRHIETDQRRQKIVNEYEDLFKNNHTIKDLAIDIQLKQRYKADTTKRTTGADTLPKDGQKRAGKANRKRTSGKSRQHHGKLPCFTGCHNNKER